MIYHPPGFWPCRTYLHSVQSSIPSGTIPPSTHDYGFIALWSSYRWIEPSGERLHYCLVDAPFILYPTTSSSSSPLDPGRATGGRRPSTPQHCSGLLLGTGGDSDSQVHALPLLTTTHPTANVGTSHYLYLPLATLSITTYHLNFTLTIFPLHHTVAYPTGLISRSSNNHLDDPANSNTTITT